MDVYQQALGDLPGGRVLDIATGGGRFVRRLVDNLPGYTEIVGIDPVDSVSNDEASIFKQPHIRFERMNAEKLDFADGNFDIVSMSGALHHLEHRDQVLGEFRRVLKPGGCGILQEAYQDGGQTGTQQMFIDLHSWFGGIDSEDGPYYHGPMFTRQAIIDTAKRLGLCDLVLYDIAELDRDPFDAETIQSFDEVIDRVIMLNGARPDAGLIRQRGEELRQRLHQTGLHGPTRLLLVGWKRG